MRLGLCALMHLANSFSVAIATADSIRLTRENKATAEYRVHIKHCIEHQTFRSSLHRLPREGIQVRMWIYFGVRSIGIVLPCGLGYLFRSRLDSVARNHN